MGDRSEIVIFKSNDGSAGIEVKLDNDTVWLTQKQIAKIFLIDRSAIAKHLNNIFKTGELEEKSNVQKMHIANADKPVKFYDLDCVISVGYRVNSKRATQFRVWATKVLKDYLVKGVSVNNDRLTELKNAFEDQKENYAKLRFFLNKFLGKVARKDVVDVLIDRVDGLSNDIDQIRKLVSKTNKDC